MLVEFSVVPCGKGEGISEDVAKVIETIEQSGLPYKLNPMGTVVEGEWDEVMGLIKKCHDTVLDGAGRVVTRIAIDDRPGRPADRITEKIKSVEKHLGREVCK